MVPVDMIGEAGFWQSVDQFPVVCYCHSVRLQSNWLLLLFEMW